MQSLCSLSLRSRGTIAKRLVVQSNMVLAILCCLSIVRSAAQGNPFPTHPVPAPTGKYELGTCTLATTESAKRHTHRRIQLWYPAGEIRATNHVKYVADKDTMTEIRNQKLLDQGPNVYDAWQKMTIAATSPRPILDRAKKYPLVLFMPGLGMPALCYTSYAQQLASDGYVVATIDYGEGGFLVEKGKLLAEGPQADDEATYAKYAEDWAIQDSEILDEIAGKKGEFAFGFPAEIALALDPKRICVMGHSLGGAAALDAIHDDNRIKACVDLDGIPEGEIAGTGVHSTVLFLRSRVEYSDADLKKLGRSREQWDARGKQIKNSLDALIKDPGGDAWMISINGTNHVSYSDLPYTAPQAISHYGGKIIAPNRLSAIWTSLVERYMEHCFDPHVSFPPKQLPTEAMIQLKRQRSR